MKAGERMDQKQIINYRQFSWLTASLLTGGGLVSIQQVLVRINRMDAWSTYMLPTIYILLIAYVFSVLVRRFPGRNLFEINKIVFRPLVGTLFNLLLLFHLWLILVRDLSSLGKFVGITLLPNTPEEIILLLLALLLMMYGKTSVEVLARVNDLFFPVFVLMIVLLPLMLSNEIDLRFIQPTLTGSGRDFLFGNLLNLGWYGDIFVMGAFLHTLWGPHQTRSAIRHGAFLASFLLGLFLLAEVMVLGPDMPGNLVYPNYTLIQQIHITDFLDRMDLLILSIWFPVTACEVILIYLAFLTGTASLIKQKDYSTINTPVVFLLLLTTILAFKSTAEVFSFGNFSSPIIVICYQPILFLLLWLLSGRHKASQSGGQQDKKQNRAADHGAKENKEADEQPHQLRARHAQRSSPLLLRLQHRGWERSSNILIALSFAALVIGLWQGRYHANIGIAAGITYGFCALFMMLTSYMELYTIRNNL
jgi:spore germination protein KB